MIKYEDYRIMKTEEILALFKGSIERWDYMTALRGFDNDYGHPSLKDYLTCFIRGKTIGPLDNDEFEHAIRISTDETAKKLIEMVEKKGSSHYLRHVKKALFNMRALGIEGSDLLHEMVSQLQPSMSPHEFKETTINRSLTALKEMVK